MQRTLNFENFYFRDYSLIFRGTNDNSKTKRFFRKVSFFYKCAECKNISNPM